ncbi:MAG: TIGR04282 family arsenosugar biosynthesis glycosyltransferase [Candidatus Latescibacterota bacterium]
MAYEKQLGVFVKPPRPGEVKTRLTPPLSPEEASRLYRAFTVDLLARLGRIKKVRGTVFYAGGDASDLTNVLPKGYSVSAQEGGTLGERLAAAFRRLLSGDGRSAVIIGSDSPDLPIQYVKRAFLKLKHKDVVLGPAADGGYYLVGARSPVPAIFEGIDWGGSSVLHQTLRQIEKNNLTLSVLPLWYDVDTPESLRLLRDLMGARRIERSGRLMATEAALSEILGDKAGWEG